MAAAAAAASPESAAAAPWALREEVVRELCGLLASYLQPGVDQGAIVAQLQRAAALPDFPSYLAFVLTRAEVRRHLLPLPPPPAAPLQGCRLAAMELRLGGPNRAAQGQAVEVRQAAGLLLKNHLKSAAGLEPAALAHVKAELLPAIGVPDRRLRATVGTVVSTLLEQGGGGAAWPQALEAFAACLDSGDYNHMEGALDALSKVPLAPLPAQRQPGRRPHGPALSGGTLARLPQVCEDMPTQLDADVEGLPDRPVNAFFPRFLQIFGSPHATLRRLAVKCTKEFIPSMPQALTANKDAFLQGLFALANDPSADVRKLVRETPTSAQRLCRCCKCIRSLLLCWLVDGSGRLKRIRARGSLALTLGGAERRLQVCASLVQLLEIQASLLEPHMKNVAEYMLRASQDPSSEVALEASEFWAAYCKSDQPQELLRDFLPRLIAVLLTNMVYDEDDEAVLEAEEDESAPDRDQDLKPRFYTPKVHGADAAEEDEDDGEIISAWNLRKCSAAGLDILSLVLNDELLPHVMPLTRLTIAGDSAWKEREAAVLALGAIAEGCINGLLPVLPQLVTFLLPLLEDKHPLVRSITCWTLSRYAKFIIQGEQQVGSQGQFDSLLSGILKRILDSNKCVQEAACSAFATLEEEAGEQLIPRLQLILQHLMYAFGKYQRRNLRGLYDALGALAESVGGELAEPQYMEILMPPLIAKWQQLSDTDKDLLPLLECFASLAQALGMGFAQYAEPVFVRCTNIIRTQSLAKVDNTRSGVVYDKDFVICSLDLLSGLAEGLGPSIESLVGRSDLRDLLLQCCSDKDADIRQSSLALLGDLAKACMVHLEPRLDDFLVVALAQLQLTDPSATNTSVTNNACWAIGEMAVKVKEAVAPIVLSTISFIVTILSQTQGMNKSLIENCAITLGRLGWVCSQLVAPHLEHFAQPWCHALRTIRDDIEKEDAFRGLCAVVRLNPSGAVPSLKSICEAIGSWHEIHSEELRAELAQVLQGFKQALQGPSWDQCMASLEPALQSKLSRKYGI
eukprot:SM000025S08460  [mRNA]  locus=s25:911945:919476:+ [translate_table: standard]